MISYDDAKHGFLPPGSSLPTIGVEKSRKRQTVKAFKKYADKKGEEHCGDLIEAHKQCMRNLGFKI